MGEFPDFESLDDLNNAIDIARKAEESVPEGSATRHEALMSLSTLLYNRWERIRSTGDLESSIDMADAAVCCTPDGDDDKPAHLVSLAVMLNRRYTTRNEVFYIDCGIKAAGMAIDLLGDGFVLRDMAFDLLHRLLGVRLGKTYEVLRTIGKVENGCFEQDADEPGLWFTIRCLTRHVRVPKVIMEMDKTIEVVDAVVNAAPPSAHGLSEVLSVLGEWFLSRSRTGDKLGKDINRAVELSVRAAKRTTSSYPARKQILESVVGCLAARFGRTGDGDDIVLAIQTLQEDLEHPSNLSESDRAILLHMLIQCQTERLERCESSVQEIDDCIQSLSDAVANAAGDPRARASCKAELGILLSLRFKRNKKELSFLNRAISSFDEAMGRILGSNSWKPQYLAQFGWLLATRYDTSGSLDDLNKAIDACAKSAVGCPAGVMKADALYTLGMFRGLLFEQTMLLPDIQQALDHLEESKKYAKPESPHNISVQNAIGIWLGKKSEVTGSEDEHLQAISIMRSVVKASEGWRPSDQRASHLTHLGTLLGRQFEKKGDLTIGNEAIEFLREAVTVCSLSEDRSNKNTYLSHLGAFLGRRFERTGIMDDIHEAISHLEEATTTPPFEHRLRAFWLNNFSLFLGKRHERTGSTRDLTRAIEAASKAVEATPTGAKVKKMRWNNLGSWYFRRAERFASWDDINLAIKYTKLALDPDNPDDPNRHATLGQLSNAYGQRYQMARFGICGSDSAKAQGNTKHEDLELALDLAEQTLASISPHHAQYVAHQSDLGKLQANLFDETKLEKHLNDSIDIMKKVVTSAPDDDPKIANYLMALSGNLERRYEIRKSADDEDQIISCYQRGWDRAQAIPSSRLLLADRAATVLVRRKDWTEASRVLEAAVQLLPMLIPRLLESDDKQHMLSNFDGLASKAAAASLNAGKDGFYALRLLESGREIMNSLLMETRKDVTEVKKLSLTLAEEFMRLRNELNSPVTTIRSASTGKEVSSELQMQRRREIEEQFRQVVDQIRQLPEFSNFLLPPSREDMLRAAGPGPVIVLNPSPYRCDAFVIEKDSGVTVVELSSLTLQDVTDRLSTLQPSNQRNGTNTKMTEVLEWMWRTIAVPCLDKLGYLDAVLGDDDKDWPHVWWVATGILSQFPIHAAGLYHDGSKNTVLDKVISSYISSIQALLHGRQGTSMLSDIESRSAVLVPMRKTPKEDHLPHADEEIEALDKLCPSLQLKPTRPEPMTNDVLEQLKTCSIFHFAGHGRSDAWQPSESCLLLQDWETNPLTVSRLHDMDIRDHRPFLGYLSACETRANERLQLADESIHLSSALQLSGFRHVIGTFWVVSDRRCVDVAKTFYEVLIKEGKSDLSVSRGLHFAVRKLRAEQAPFLGNLRIGHYKPKGGSSKVGIERTTRIPMGYAWVPYAHFGA